MFHKRLSAKNQRALNFEFNNKNLLSYTVKNTGKNIDNLNKKIEFNNQVDLFD